mmetsp:Transcript_26107/g.59021  ORF Transcript_26107/g.59021 Transcript_26107/m.59021 type:complete len:230 (-) Transcript_26107:716-1405(-)
MLLLRIPLAGVGLALAEPLLRHLQPHAVLHGIPLGLLFYPPHFHFFPLPSSPRLPLLPGPLRLPDEHGGGVVGPVDVVDPLVLRLPHPGLAREIPHYSVEIDGALQHGVKHNRVVRQLDSDQGKPSFQPLHGQRRCTFTTGKRNVSLLQSPKLLLQKHSKSLQRRQLGHFGRVKRPPVLPHSGRGIARRPGLSWRGPRSLRRHHWLAAIFAQATGVPYLPRRGRVLAVV